uniref:Coatomer beta subunit n=1 Tax=Triticum urartu TaxID=4572 RepID=A0A8R7UWR9_TRIUA
VSLAKFIAREQWILAGFTSGLLCVYSCDSQNRIHVLHEHSTSIKSLAIHSTKPYVLSASRDGKILLWDYGKEWQLIKAFDANSWLDKGDTVEQVAFHPKDNDLFASAQGKTVKFWNLHSGECKHILSGHSDSVVCLDYFSLGHKLYWITGSQDRTAKIWDFETRRCVHSLKGHMDVVNIVCCHPDLPILITASWDGSVHLWDSTTFRLVRVLKFKLGKVNSIACLKGSTSIAIGHEKGLVLADIRP